MYCYDHKSDYKCDAALGASHLTKGYSLTVLLSFISINS